MKKILYTLSAVAFMALPAQAQLFDPSAISYKPAPLVTDSNTNTKRQIQTQESGLFPELSTGTPRRTTSNSESQMNAGIELVLDNVEILNPPAGLALCTGVLILKNGTNMPLSELEMTVEYGTIPLDVTFGNTPPRSQKTHNIALAGPSCQLFLNPPKIDITKCSLPNMSLDDCKAQIKYVPITNAR